MICLANLSKTVLIHAHTTYKEGIVRLSTLREEEWTCIFHSHKVFVSSELSLCGLGNRQGQRTCMWPHPGLLRCCCICWVSNSSLIYFHRLAVLLGFHMWKWLIDKEINFLRHVPYHYHITNSTPSFMHFFPPHAFFPPCTTLPHSLSSVHPPLAVQSKGTPTLPHSPQTGFQEWQHLETFCSTVEGGMCGVIMNTQLYNPVDHDWSFSMLQHE